MIKFLSGESEAREPIPLILGEFPSYIRSCSQLTPFCTGLLNVRKHLARLTSVQPFETNRPG